MVKLLHIKLQMLIQIIQIILYGFILVNLLNFLALVEMLALQIENMFGLKIVEKHFQQKVDQEVMLIILDHLKLN